MVKFSCRYVDDTLLLVKPADIHRTYTIYLINLTMGHLLFKEALKIKEEYPALNSNLKVSKELKLF